MKDFTTFEVGPFDPEIGNSILATMFQYTPEMGGKAFSSVKIDRTEDEARLPVCLEIRVPLDDKKADRLRTIVQNIGNLPLGTLIKFGDNEPNPSEDVAVGMNLGYLGIATSENDFI